MHVVQLLPELNQGDMERGVVDFNRELVKRGHASTVVSIGGRLARQIELDGGRHVEFDTFSKNFLSLPARVGELRRELLRLKPNIVHAHSRVPAWLCFFANCFPRTPFVTTVHGFNGASLYNSIMTRGDRVIFGSSAIRDHILENYRVDESKLRYVPRGIDTTYFDPELIDKSFIAEFKRKHKLANRYIVSIVGRVTEWKGHDCLIRALAMVQKEHPEMVGVVAGGAWHGKEGYLHELRLLADDCGAEIRFAGPQSQVREIHALSDLVVSAASTRPEPFGRTVAEALAMDTPVVASAQGGSLDILQDGINGLLFPPGDSAALADRIRQALRHPFANMRPHIEANFSLTHMIETELAVYSELL